MAPGFPVKALFGFSTIGEMHAKNLDRDGAVEACIPCTVHLAHAACAERGNDFIRPEFGATGEGHPRAIIFSSWLQ